MIASLLSLYNLEGRIASLLSLYNLEDSTAAEAVRVEGAVKFVERKNSRRCARSTNYVNTTGKN